METEDDESTAVPDAEKIGFELVKLRIPARGRDPVLNRFTVKARVENCFNMLLQLNISIGSSINESQTKSHPLPSTYDNFCFNYVKISIQRMIFHYK